MTSATVIMKPKTQRRKPHRSNTSPVLPSRSLHVPADAPKLSVHEKLATWLQGLNKTIDVFSFLGKVAEATVVQLQIPETLVVEEGVTFLFTDSTGALRLVSGEMALTDFVAMAGEKHRQLKNMNPQGVRFPKFITFTQGRLEYTLRRTSDMKRYLSQKSGCRVQRYVWPENYNVKKMLIRWRRTKRSKIYTITPRTALKAGAKVDGDESFSLDTAFVASTAHLKSCDISKEHVCDELHAIVDVALRLVQRYALSATEQLEELSVCVTRSQDGKLYFLDAPAARVTRFEEQTAEASERKPEVSPLSREYDISERLKTKLLPYISLSDVSEQSDRLYQLQLRSTQLPAAELRPLLSDARISQHLTEVSAQFDTVHKESQVLKQEFGIVMKVQLQSYPKDTLEQVVRKVYDNITRDSRLSRYYYDKSRIFTKLMFAVKAVFLAGLSRNIRERMRHVHTGMGITDSDFDLYVRYFCEAMESLGVKEEHVEQTKTFLECFRADVVQRLLDKAAVEAS